MLETLISSGLYGVVQVGDWIFAHGGLVKSLVERFSPKRQTDGAPTPTNNFIVNINKRVKRLALVNPVRNRADARAALDKCDLQPSTRRWLKGLRNQNKKRSPRWLRRRRMRLPIRGVKLLQYLALRPTTRTTRASRSRCCGTTRPATPSDNTVQSGADCNSPIGYRVGPLTRVVVGHSVQHFRGTDTATRT